MNDRLDQIAELIPKDVKSILDIGSGNKYFKKCTKKYCSLDVKDGDIVKDLNVSQKIPLRKESFDMVILSQILEHLANPKELIKESKRISKKFVLVGLPNEITIDNRIKLLIGKPNRKGYSPYGHKHFFTIGTIEEFIKKMYGKYYKKIYIFSVKGGRFLPLSLRKRLAKMIPPIFAGEVYYLIKK